MATAVSRRFLRVGQDHLAHGVDAVALEEHVLGAAEADALRAEGDRVGDLVGLVRVGADLQAAELVGPAHELREVAVGRALLAVERLVDEHLDDFRRRGLHFAGEDFAAGAVDGEEVALA